MVRKKKSLLLSASLASAGLVAGALMTAAPKTQATEYLSSTEGNDAAIQSISQETGFSASIVKKSFNSKNLIITIDDENELKNNEDIANYRKVAESVYVVNFKDYESALENYDYYKDSGKAKAVELNVPLKIMDTPKSIPAIVSDGDGIPEMDKCFNIDPQTYTFTNYTRVPDQCLSWGTDSMKLLDYAKSTSSTKTIKVAVVDTGINASHEAFSYSSENAKDRLDMSLAYDYYGSGPIGDWYYGDSDPDDSGNDVDDDGNRITHGTSVAGLVAESTPYNVKVVPIRITKGKELDLNLALHAVSELKGKVDVINLSLGSYEQIGPEVEGYSGANQVLKEAKEAGTIVVAAAGNNGQDFVSFPASSEYTIAVGATDEENHVTSFSQRGSQIDFAAPGNALLTPNGESTSMLEVNYGTSFATPLIAAAIANILSENPTYNFDQVYNTLKLNTEDIETTGKDNKSGWGSVSFHINKFADLSLSEPTTTPAAGTWTNGSVTINSAATSNAYNIDRFIFSTGSNINTTPSSWSSISNPAKTYNLSQNANANGTYTIWVMNSNNETAAKTVTVSNIDKTEPTVSAALSASNLTTNGATLNVGVTDSESGLGKIVWHYKVASADSYTDKTDSYATSGTGATSATTKAVAITGLEESTQYSAYATVYDVAGNSKDSASISFTTRFTGESIAATGVTLNKTSATISVGDSVVMVATIAPDDSTDTITWSSSDETIATVSAAGEVAGIKAGTVTITARANENAVATATITVQDIPATISATGIEITPKSATNNVGDSILLGAAVSPSGATDTITWSSSDESVATVSTTGKVAGIKAGTVTITARANENAVATATITVQGPTTPSQGNTPKPVNTNNGVKNPKTADMNVAAVTGLGAVLSAAAFFIFRSKRR